EKLAEASARRAIRAPDRLNLISLEELRQLSAVLGNDPRKRNGEVVAQRQIGLPGRLVLAPPKDFEDQPVAFLAVLAGERLDVLERRRFEWLEAIALVHRRDDANHVLAPADVFGQEIAHAARRPGLLRRHQRTDPALAAM